MTKKTKAKTKTRTKTKTNKRGDDDLRRMITKFSATYGMRDDPEQVEMDLEMLGVYLDTANDIFMMGKNNARAGMMRSLEWTIHYLDQELPAIHSERQLLPLRRLLRALEDLDSSILHAALKMQKRPGGSVLVKSDAEFQLLAIAAAECYPDLSIKDSQRRVAEQLTKQGFFKSRQSQGSKYIISDTTIANWKKEMNKIVSMAVGNRLTVLQWVMRQCRMAMIPENEHILHKKPGGDFIVQCVIPVVCGHLRHKG
jgi:hypothetical protein